MSLFEEWADEDDRLDQSRWSRPPACYTVVDHGRWFRRLFPKQHYTVFFRQLERMTKRKLSFSERSQIISAGFRLLSEKEYVETAEDFASQLKSEAETKKTNISRIKEIYLLADQLHERIRSLHGLTILNFSSEIRDYVGALYAPLSTQDSSAPIDEVFQRVLNTSKNKIEELKPTGKRGPLPDAALRKCISELAQVFGEENATAPYSRKEGRRASPFIDFVQQILYALPENAMIGRNGPYLPAAIEAHVHAVCADLKKALPDQNKKPKLAD